MSWLFIIAYLAITFWWVRRRREKRAEYAAAGLFRSPLYWTTSTLTFTLLGLTMYMADLHRGPISPWLWLIAMALFIIILRLRSALKWRYPI